MAVQVQFRRGNTSQHSTFTGAEGEITVNTDKDILVVHDGTTVGGHEMVSNAQLSANLASYQTTAGLSANVATLTANNTSNFNSQPASFYTNATNITTGTLPYAQIPANIVNTTADFTRTGITTFSANIIIDTTAKISANGSYGTANQVLTNNGNGVFWSTTSGGFTNGQSISVNNFVVTGSITANGSNGVAGYVLHSNGSTAYWAIVEAGSNGTVTSVATGNGMVGGNITTTGTVSVLANTGIVANADGVFVNAAYIQTISANNANNLGGQLPAYYTNATNITTGTLPYAQIPVNVINTTADFTRTGVTTFSANVVLGTSGISSNGSFGTSGQVLTTNGSSTYWSTSAGGGGGISSLSFVGFYSGYNNPTTGTLRRYFANNITVTKMTAWVGVTSGSNLKLTLKKNGSEIANTIIAANASIANVSFSANVISDVDYLTLDLTSGSGTDIGVRIDYTPYA
jgi:hypothetical protein